MQIAFLPGPARPFVEPFVLTSSKPAEALTCTFGMVDGGSAPYRSNSWEQILDFDDDE